MENIKKDVIWEMSVNGDVMDQQRQLLQILIDRCDIDRGGPAVSRRMLLGPLITMYKRIARPFVRMPINDIIERQKEFNNAATSLLQTMSSRLDDSAVSIDVLKSEISEVKEAIKPPAVEPKDALFEGMFEVLKKAGDFFQPLPVSSSEKDIIDPKYDKKADAVLESVKGLLEKNLGLDSRTYFDVSSMRYRYGLCLVQRYIQPGGRILDIGCSPGHFSMAMHLLGYNVSGIDLNSEWSRYYPEKEWIKKLDVNIHNIEQDRLPFQENTFDAVIFTEVLEHIAILDPRTILEDIRKVLKPGGFLLFSTPNVANISNLFSILNGCNVFWPTDIFYGSTDRHNREYTVTEAESLIKSAGYANVDLYMFNCASNWNTKGAQLAEEFVCFVNDRIDSLATKPLLKNTIFMVAQK